MSKGSQVHPSREPLFVKIIKASKSLLLGATPPEDHPLSGSNLLYWNWLGHRQVSSYEEGGMNVEGRLGGWP